MNAPLAIVHAHAHILLADAHVEIPTWVTDLDSFRHWARSPAFPERGRFAFIGKDLWVDLSMERAAHNQIKGEIGRVHGNLAKAERRGIYFGDRMLLTNVEAGVSNEPDGMYVSNEALESGRAQLVEGDDSLEVVGSADMVLEIVSAASVRKDTRELRAAYWKAKIAEYWLVDSRVENPVIELLRRGSTKYVAVRPRSGWVKSAVFGKEFRLTRRETRSGISEFTLEVR